MVESHTSAQAVESLYSIVSYPEVLSDSKLTRPTGRSPLVILRVVKDQRSLSSSISYRQERRKGQERLDNWLVPQSPRTTGGTILEKVPRDPRLMGGSATSGSRADKGKQRAA